MAEDTKQLKQNGENIFPKIKIADNLVTDESETALSAKQGKALNETKSTVTVSEGTVVGAKTIRSIGVDGTQYNIIGNIYFADVKGSPESNTQLKKVLEEKQLISNMTDSLDGEISDLYPSAKLLKNKLALNEILANKKNVIDDSTDTGEFYPTVHATKEYVNSAVQTMTANFQGAYKYWALVPSTAEEFKIEPKKNDYLVVLEDENHSGESWKYKYLMDQDHDEGYSKDNWVPEYKLNDGPFTGAQWLSINSGITPQLVAEITILRGELNELKHMMLTAREPSRK